MSEYNISASQVKTHSKCPKQYWYRYPSDYEGTKVNDRYLKLGNRVHTAIEDVLNEKDGVQLSDKRTLQASIQNRYRELEQFDVPDKQFDEGIDCCETAAKFIAAQEPSIEYIEHREEFWIDRDDISTGVTAIMDIVTNREIWDWKTGRIRDDTAHDEKIQGSIYMAGYLELMGRPPESVVFVYLKEGKKRTIEVDDDAWQYMLGHAKKLVRSKESGEFRAKPGDHCYWCGFEGFCSSSPVGIGGVPYDEY